MDLASLNAGASDGAKMQILHPGTNEPIPDSKGEPITITMLSKDHPSVQAAWRTWLQETIDTRKSGKKVSEDFDPDLEVLIVATVAWSIEEYAGDKNPRCIAENVRKVYKNEIWLREQATTFYAKRANFIPASS